MDRLIREETGELIDLLMPFKDDNKIEIEVYETISGRYVDTTTADIAFVEDAWDPILRIDVKAEKPRTFLKWGHT